MSLEKMVRTIWDLGSSMAITEKISIDDTQKKKKMESKHITSQNQANQKRRKQERERGTK